MDEYGTHKLLMDEYNLWYHLVNNYRFVTISSKFQNSAISLILNFNKMSIFWIILDSWFISKDNYIIILAVVENVEIEKGASVD